MSRERITSRSNPLIARLRRLKSQRAARRAEGVFLCEGPQMLAEALRWGARLETVVCAQGAEERLVKGSSARSLLDRLIGA